MYYLLNFYQILFIVAIKLLFVNETFSVAQKQKIIYANLYLKKKETISLVES